MHTTRRTIWYLAIWLILAFPTLLICPPAAACNGMEQADSMPRGCCRFHPAFCACNVAPGYTPHNMASSGSCRMSDCPCAVSPAPESAPAPQAIVFVVFPAILTYTPRIVAPTAILCTLPIADTNQSSQSVSRSSTSSRAPPFQG